MLQIGIYDSSAGSLYLDISTRASNVVIVNGEHGFGSLACFVRMSLAEAFMLYDRPGIPHVQVTEFGLQVWAGRLEDVAIVAGGVRLTALGYWRALTDVPYTSLWSYAGVAGWRMLTQNDGATLKNQLYAVDFLNRIYMGLTKNTIYGNNTDAAYAIFFAPDGSRQAIKYVSVDYDYSLPVNWTLRLVAYDGSSLAADASNITTIGGAATGTKTWAVTINNAIAVGIEIFNSTGANYTMAGETGGFYAKATNFRANERNSATINADMIATDLAIYVNGINSAQLSASAALISSPGVDLTSEVYADALPADILDRLARLGDNITPVSLYETGVWENQLLTFQKRGATARTWYVDISALELERTITALRNSMYADYQEAGGRTLRTTTSDDSASVARYGLTRRGMVSTQTTSSTLAGTSRDAALQDGKDPKPLIAIAIDRIYDAAGSVYPLWMVRAWDTIVIRNLPLTLSAALDRIRTFRNIEARYDVDANRLTVTPESRMPTLVAQAARQQWDLAPVAPVIAARPDPGVVPAPGIGGTGMGPGDLGETDFSGVYGGTKRRRLGL